MQAAAPLPLLLHVLYRFDTGGLENGVVNLVNRLTQYRHAVLAIDECVPSFCQRVSRPDVSFISLRKPPGQTLQLAPRFLAELRSLQPAVVHTRNLAALEMQLPAWWWGRAARVHGEHGRDSDDLHGLSRRHQWMRRIYRPFVQRYVALSGDLEHYLTQRVGVPASRVTRICNGVDTERFFPAPTRQPLEGSPFNDTKLVVVGTVGRMQTVKAQIDLVDAFVLALKTQPTLHDRLRLVMAGEGPLRQACLKRLQEAGVAHLAWLPGERTDIPEVMRHLSFFALPSHAEGISNTVLEAMASGLPVLATKVGGNAELVEEGVTGALVDANRPDSLSAGMVTWSHDPTLISVLGEQGHRRCVRHFSLDAMVGAYDGLYRGLLGIRSNLPT